MRIVSRMRNDPVWSAWYQKKVDYKDYFMVKGGQEFPISGIPQMAMSLPEGHRQRRRISGCIKQLISNDGKWISFYCHSGHRDPYAFVRWVKEKDYHFNDAYGFEKTGNVWSFHGNLAEVSCAFSFRIFDRSLAENVRTYIYRNLDIPKKIRTCLYCHQTFEVTREGHHWHSRKCRNAWYRLKRPAGVFAGVGG